MKNNYKIILLKIILSVLLIFQFSSNSYDQNTPDYTPSYITTNYTPADPETINLTPDVGNAYLNKYISDNGDAYILINNCPLPLEFKFTLNQTSKNVSYFADQLVDLLPYSDKTAFRIEPNDKTLDWSYSFSYIARFGFSDLPAPSEFNQYLLPYSSDTKFQIIQGETGSFSHYGEYLYSIDFAMPEGTPVTAIRDGLVVFTKEDSNENGTDESYINKANYVWILHSDGTIGNYAHFKYNSVTVNKGDKVTAGQLIGYSGNTGYSTCPHLHLQVFLCKGFAGALNIPIRFKDIDGALVQGDYY